MMLRWLVANWVGQTARQTLSEAAAAASGQSRGAGPQSDDADAAPVEEEVPPCQIAFLFALGVEAGGLVDMLSQRVVTRCPNFLEHAGYLQEHRVIVAESGVGRQAAARAAADVIALHQPAWIVSAGFAGALVPELRRGHMLLADEVVDLQGNTYSIGLKVDRQSIESSPGVHVGRLLTVDELIRTRQDKEALAERSSAVACDMETAAVAQVCGEAKARLLSVRIISDAIDDELPPEIERLLDQKSLAAKLGAVTGAIFKRPSSVKDMWKLKEDALKATDRLARFLVGISERLI